MSLLEPHEVGCLFTVMQCKIKGFWYGYWSIDWMGDLTDGISKIGLTGWFTGLSFGRSTGSTGRPTQMVVTLSLELISERFKILIKIQNVQFHQKK